VIENLELAPVPTQNALFEVMRNNRLLLHGYRYTTAEIFTVILVTTVNNEESEKTNEFTDQMYDQFLLKTVLNKPLIIHPSLEGFAPAYTAKELLALRAAVNDVFLHKDVEQYMRNIVVSLRNYSLVIHGPSPRASIALKQAVRVAALMSGVQYITPSHVVSIAPAVLSHRFKVKPNPNSPVDVVLYVIEHEVPPI